TPVNDAPVVSDQTFSVAENSAKGTVVKTSVTTGPGGGIGATGPDGTIVVTDPDVGQTETFAVTGGTGQATFNVNATTGQITVANSVDLNFEATPSFTLNIRVTDNGTPAMSDTAVVTVNLTNVIEPHKLETRPAVARLLAQLAEANQSAAASSTRFGALMQQYEARVDSPDSGLQSADGDRDPVTDQPSGERPTDPNLL